MGVREKTASKKRLIDADALLNKLLERYTERERNKNLVFAACEIKQDFADMISDFPTVDAVEVVRCQECKYRFGNNGHSKNGCPIIDANIWMDDDDFCSYGERKEGADNG